MFSTAQRPTPRRGAGRKQRFFYNRPTHITKKPPPPSTLPQIKNWCIDLLAEALFDGADSLDHRWAKRFWARSGRRLKSV